MNNEKVYLKIGLFQSVVPVPIDDNSTTLAFDGIDLHFGFADSGEREKDGVPIWVAKSVEVVNY